MAFTIFAQFKKPSDPGSAVLGSSQDASHPHWIEILSWSHEVTRSVSATTREAETAVRPPDISMMTEDGAAFTGLVRGCSMGVHYGSVTMEVVREGRVFLTVELAEVFISSCRTAGGSRGTIPAMEFTLSASKVKFEYKTGESSTGSPAQSPSPPPPKKTKP